MTPEIKPADLRKTVYTTGGGFREADGTLSLCEGPAIRSSNMPKLNGRYPRADDVDRHFVVHSNPLSFKLQDGLDRTTKVLSFHPAGNADNIIYLQEQTKNITSTVIPTNDQSVRYFITDPMSGCNFFIDELQDGNLVCHHANARHHSLPEAEVRADAGAFSQDALDAMDEQYRTALQAFPGATPVTNLRVADYYAKAQGSVDRLVDQGNTDVEFNGGATIMGFRVGSQWEFWFQTYANLTYRSPTGTAVKAPKEIIQVRRFWPR